MLVEFQLSPQLAESQSPCSEAVEKSQADYRDSNMLMDLYLDAGRGDGSVGRTGGRQKWRMWVVKLSCWVSWCAPLGCDGTVAWVGVVSEVLRRVIASMTKASPKGVIF